MKTEPQKEHDWLHQLVGDWTYASMGSDENFEGAETVRSLGGIWIIAEGKGSMPGGGTAETVMSLGFDPASKRYTGTWIGSMMPFLWNYDGGLDETGQKLILKSRGPSMAADGSLSDYEDIIEIVSPNERLLRSRTPAPDGQWNEFMRVRYQRKP